MFQSWLVWCGTPTLALLHGGSDDTACYVIWLLSSFNRNKILTEGNLISASAMFVSVILLLHSFYYILSNIDVGNISYSRQTNLNTLQLSLDNNSSLENYWIVGIRYRIANLDDAFSNGPWQSLLLSFWRILGLEVNKECKNWKIVTRVVCIPADETLSLTEFDSLPLEESSCKMCCIAIIKAKTKHKSNSMLEEKEGLHAQFCMVSIKDDNAYASIDNN